MCRCSYRLVQGMFLQCTPSSSWAIAAPLHRDIKPEHFLLSDSSSAAQLKAIDFGISLFLKPDQLHEVGVSGFL